MDITAVSRGLCCSAKNETTAKWMDDCRPPDTYIWAEKRCNVPIFNDCLSKPAARTQACVTSAQSKAENGEEKISWGKPLLYLY